MAELDKSGFEKFVLNVQEPAPGQYMNIQCAIGDRDMFDGAFVHKISFTPLRNGRGIGGLYVLTREERAGGSCDVDIYESKLYIDDVETETLGRTVIKYDGFDGSEEIIAFFSNDKNLLENIDVKDFNIVLSSTDYIKLFVSTIEIPEENPLTN